MDFITKKQFEDACNVIQKALDNKQIVHAPHNQDVSISMAAAIFFDENLDAYRYNQITFLAPDIAIKNNLHEVQKRLKVERESFHKSQKELEELEIKEQRLIKALAVLKG